MGKIISQPCFFTILLLIHFILKKGSSADFNNKKMWSLCICGLWIQKTEMESAQKCPKQTDTFEKC